MSRCTRTVQCSRSCVDMHRGGYSKLEAELLGLQDPHSLLLGHTEVLDFPSRVFPLLRRFSSLVSDVLAATNKSSLSTGNGRFGRIIFGPAKPGTCCGPQRASFLCHGGGKDCLGSLSKVGQEMALPLG